MRIFLIGCVVAGVSCVLGACSSSGLLVGEADAGPVQADAGATNADGGGDENGDAGHEAGFQRREPDRHRSSAVECPHTRSPGTAPSDEGGECQHDSDCTQGKNGRCFNDLDPGLNWCSYDDCYTDADCGTGKVCSCRDGEFGANRCAVANCQTDADCPNSWCSPSYRTSQGAYYVSIEGYYCHTALDTCNDDKDCTSGGLHCGWAQTHWACTP